jgi:hypothetical protein
MAAPSSRLETKLPAVRLQPPATRDNRKCRRSRRGRGHRGITALQQICFVWPSNSPMSPTLPNLDQSSLPASEVGHGQSLPRSPTSAHTQEDVLRTRRKILRQPTAPLRDAIQGKIRPPYPRFPGHFPPPLRPNFASSGIHVEPFQTANGIPNRLIRLQTLNNSTISHSNSQIQSRRSCRLSSNSVPLKYWIQRKNSSQDARYRFRPPSMSAILTSMKNLNYMSDHMCAFGFPSSTSRAEDPSDSCHEPLRYRGNAASRGRFFEWSSCASRHRPCALSSRRRNETRSCQG